MKGWDSNNLGRIRRTLSISFVCTLLLSATPLCAYAQSADMHPVQLMTSAERAQIERLLSEDLQRVANRKTRFEGQTQPLHITAAFDLQTDRVLVDIGAKYGPISNAPEMEDLQGELYEATSQLLENLVSFKGITLVFGGKDMYYFHPEEWRASRPSPLRQSNTQANGGTNFHIDPIIGPTIPDLDGPAIQPGAVIISAGHGIYYNYQYKDWRAQRDPSNGITEDFITPLYATELKAWMDQRSTSAVIFPRAIPATTHEPSGKPWWKISARYNLESLYPNHPEMWHSKPELTDGQRERLEDIDSRPLYANYLRANAILSIHTNAADISASGTKAFHQDGRATDQALGNSVLCYMAEQIHAKPAYSQYPVARQSVGQDYAENRLATRPAIIIEVGFHTNPNDALALQDPAFRTAAMKGVEKGYRLFTQGKPCDPFAITSIPEASAPIGTPFTLQVSFKGYPQFPVKRVSKFVGCPSGWTCTDTEEVIATQTDGPIPIPRLCTGSTSVRSTTFTQRTTLTDTDGVSTSMENRYTCTGGTQSLNDSTTAGGSNAT